MPHGSTASQFLLLLLLIWSAVASPLRHSPLSQVSDVDTSGIRNKPTSNIPTVHDLPETRNGTMGVSDYQRALAKRTAGPGYIGCKLLARHEQYLILPGVVGATALKSFWQTVSLKAIYNNAFSEPPSALFTITEGLLQVTFSCLGAKLPWKTVAEIAMNAVGSVQAGYLDTFDAIYEEELTGITVWVSLRILDKVAGVGKTRRSP